VNSSELKARLTVAQDALGETMRAGNFELLTELMEKRQPLVEQMVEYVASDSTLKSWVQDFVARDQDILAQARHHLNEVSGQLSEAKIKRQAHLSYLRSSETSE